MRMTIYDTPTLTKIEGVPVRLWMGLTEKGTACHVFVHRIAVLESEHEEFDRELIEVKLWREYLPAPGAGWTE